MAEMEEVENSNTNPFDLFTSECNDIELQVIMVIIFLIISNYLISTLRCELILLRN